MVSERKIELPMLKRIILIALIVANAASIAFPAASSGDEDESAPIVERKMDFHDFTLKAVNGQDFNLREYALDKRVVIVSFIAGWCRNSNQNGPVIKRLYDKYRNRGLGVVAVSEYSTRDEINVHINRIGIDYPVVLETDDRDDRKRSMHYKYRRLVNDPRKWGTPFYVIIDTREIEPGKTNGPLVRHAYTVSGEIIEPEAESFLEKMLR